MASRPISSRAADRGVALAGAGVAAALFTAVLALGRAVTATGEPAWLQSVAIAARGQATGAAWALTHAVYPQVLGPIYLALLVAAGLLPSIRVRAIAVVLCGLVAWRIDDALQRAFARPRRPDWLVHHETTYSYPSSHAAIVAASFWLAAWLVARAPGGLPLRAAGAAALALLGLAVIWSRLSLAAHYPTDLMGGALLGGAVVAGAEALLRTFGRTLARG